MRFAAVFAMLCAGVLALSGCSSASTGSGRGTGSGSPSTVAQAATATHRSSARTVVHTFAAYRADGTPTVTATRTVDGYCWDSSLAVSSATAFRCFAGAGSASQILDPCFVPPTEHPASVICLNDPWSPATTLHLTRALPDPVAAESARPWAFQLAGGARCVASTGTVPTVRGVNLSYHCSDGTAASLEQTDAPAWTAVDADPGATALHTTTVTGVWQT